MIEERGHWRVLSRESKYRNDFIELIEDKVITDRGKEGLFGVIKTNDN